MPKSNPSSDLPSPTSTDNSEQTRCTLLLLQQLRGLLASLPDSCAQSSSRLNDMLRAISTSDIAAQNGLENAVRELQQTCKASDANTKILIGVLETLASKLEISNAAREQDRVDRKRVEDKVDRLSSQLALLNE